jgi:hypothetical protein
MTRIRGVRIMAAPCCGARFSAPRYLSMNFMAFAYWTDGWRENSLMPNGEGLRQCTCGKFTLFKDLEEIGTGESSDLPFISLVHSELLPVCIATADNEELEVAARLEYWRELNHAYRERYRTHRDAEEAENQAIWELQNPDSRTWWDKLRGKKAPSYIRTDSTRFTFPEFDPSPEQLHNMDRLCEIFDKWSQKSLDVDKLTLAELYREQGRFIEAQEIISIFHEHDEGITRKLITKLIYEKQPALMRYRM